MSVARGFALYRAREGEEQGPTGLGEGCRQTPLPDVSNDGTPSQLAGAQDAEGGAQPSGEAPLDSECIPGHSVPEDGDSDLETGSYEMVDSQAPTSPVSTLDSENREHPTPSLTSSAQTLAEPFLLEEQIKIFGPEPLCQHNLTCKLFIPKDRGLKKINLFLCLNINLFGYRSPVFKALLT